MEVGQSNLANQKKKELPVAALFLVQSMQNEFLKITVGEKKLMSSEKLLCYKHIKVSIRCKIHFTHFFFQNQNINILS